jgi:pimeloyl-ACP methyl ester carboxylesterase
MGDVMMGHRRISRAGAVFRPVDFEAYVGRHRIYVEGVRPEMETGRPAIVFVGGAFDGSWICRQQLDYWAARGWPAYALNLRGYYKSRYRGVAGLGYRDYLDDIGAACEHFALEKPVYAGYSIGGILVQKFAELHGARALILYDSDWPRQVARTIREAPDLKKRIPAVMNFWPPKSVVEEMMGGAVRPEEYRAMLALFKRSFLSGRAYRELELERIEVDAAKLTCPVLMINVSSRDRAQAAQAKYLKASRLLLEGYSHGSILISRFHGPITRRVTEWMEAGFPRGINERHQFAKVILEQKGRERMKLVYFTGWQAPVVRVCNRRGQELSQLPMKRLKRGRFRDESAFGATVPLDPGSGFYIAEGVKEDRPFPRGFYEPTGSTMHLMDGEFFPHPPPLFRQPAVYFTKEIYSRALAHHFRVNIMLPRDYGRGGKGPYPVVVLNDGQNQWKDQGAYGGWHTDAIALDKARRGRSRDIVLAAVVSHSRRDAAYLPPPRGIADAYVDFLADTVLPTLRKAITISQDPREIGLIGASYGANCAIYAGLKRPDTFGLVGSLSYADMPDDPLRKWMGALAKLPFKRLYIDCGTRWAYDQRSRDDFTSTTRELIAIAREKGMAPGETLLGVIAEGHFHNEIYWRKRIGRCLEFICPLG